MHKLKRELKGQTTPSEAVIMEKLSREYGWTPSEIRETNIDDILSYLNIIDVRKQIEKMKK